MSQEETPVLEARNITKRFPGVLANDSVNFTLRKGEIHALLGENGAGKSTLMNIIYGLYSPDEGEIYINGQPVQIKDPNDAIAQGIGMVHQHFMLVPVFTVAENIILGAEITRGPTLNMRTARRRIRELFANFGLHIDPDTVVEQLPVGLQQRVEIVKALYRNARILVLDEPTAALTPLDMRTARRRIRELFANFGLHIDPDTVVEQLPVGLQQRVEIVKALYRDARILVLDEPTAVLTPQEAEDLFRIMRDLANRGVSIIFITHKLKEVLAIADNITVMRRGRVVGTAKPQGMTEQDLATMMVGRDVILSVEKKPARPGKPVLQVRDLTILDERKVPVVRDVSFEVYAGEVLGIAGVQGNGQTELAEALTGLRPAESGTMILGGEAVPFNDPRLLIEHGLAHIPEDRQRHGLVLPYTIVDNLVLCTYYKRPFAKGIRRNPRAMEAQARQLIEEFDVRTPGPYELAANLSGGNQQKVIVARELSRPVQLLIANQPTRGLDVGSIEFIHRRIIQKRDEGIAVLLISAELDEIMSLADRIAVMFHGRIVAMLPAAEATRGQLGLLMAGADPASADPAAQNSAPRETAGQEQKAVS